MAHGYHQSAAVRNSHESIFQQTCYAQHRLHGVAGVAVCSRFRCRQCLPAGTDHKSVSRRVRRPFGESRFARAIGCSREARCWSRPCRGYLQGAVSKGLQRRHAIFDQATVGGCPDRPRTAGHRHCLLDGGSAARIDAPQDGRGAACHAWATHSIALLATAAIGARLSGMHSPALRDPGHVATSSQPSDRLCTQVPRTASHTAHARGLDNR